MNILYSQILGTLLLLLLLEARIQLEIINLMKKKSELDQGILDRLSHLVPLNELNKNKRIELFNHGELIILKKNKFLFKQGDEDAYCYYLLEGELELLANDQLHNTIVADSDRSRYPLAQLQPRQFSAKVITPVKVLRLERELLDRALVVANQANVEKNNDSTPTDNELTVSEIEPEDDVDWMTRMLQSELFSLIPTGNIHQLFALLEPVEYEAEDIIIQQGEPGSEYFIVAEGTCTVTCQASEMSTVVTLATLEPGEGFGEEALLAETTRNATVTMKTAGTLMRLGKENFISLIMEPAVKAVDVQNAQQLVHQGAQWLDVRFNSEHQNSCIQDSLNIPLNLLRSDSSVLKPNLHYVVYCDTGGRSSAATFVLADRGIKASYLKGGLVSNPTLAKSNVLVKKHNLQAEVKTIEEKISQTEKIKEQKIDSIHKEIKTQDTAQAEQATGQTIEQSEKNAFDLENMDPDIKATAIEANLERTNSRLKEVKRLPPTDEVTQIEYNKVQSLLKEKLEAEKKILEQEKQKARDDAKKLRQQEQEKIELIKRRKQQELAEEKKKIEEIYNKNAKEMEKIEEMKKLAEQETLIAKQQLEKQEKEIEQQKSEAERLKAEIEKKAKAEQVRTKKASEEAKKLLKQAQQMKEEMERSQLQMQEEAEKKRKLQEQMEERLQQEMKQKLEVERKKLAEQIKSNAKELELAQKEKLAAEAARKAAYLEAQKIIAEQKSEQESLQVEQEKKLHEERKKLQAKTEEIKSSLESLKLEKQQCEREKNNANRLIADLKKQQQAGVVQNNEDLQGKIYREINDAKSKVKQSENQLKIVNEAEKKVSVAAQMNDAELIRNREQIKNIENQLNHELVAFTQDLEKRERALASKQSKIDIIRIQQKAEEAKLQVEDHDIDLLADISSQLKE